MTEPKIREKYGLLKKTHSLPDFDKLNNEFEITTIDHDDFLLRAIIRKITEKIEEFSKNLENLLQPETSINDMYESKFFDDKEKKEVFNIHKNLMLWQRKALVLEIEKDEKKEADFINDFFKEWVKIKNNLAKIFRKMEECWKREEDSKTDLRYVG